MMKQDLSVVTSRVSSAQVSCPSPRASSAGDDRFPTCGPPVLSWDLAHCFTDRAWTQVAQGSCRLVDPG